MYQWFSENAGTIAVSLILAAAVAAIIVGPAPDDSEALTFLLEQIALKDKRMDDKDALIRQLLEKVL